MKLDEIFDKVAQQMRADFEKAREALQHPGLRGAAAEDIFRTFLCEYLPKSLDVSTGMLVDANGQSSRQSDVIISDAAKTPIFYKSKEVRVIPIECAYAVIEVKSKLDSRELRRSFINMKSIRALKKQAYFDPNVIKTPIWNLYGRRWDIWPVNYFVFAFDSIKLGTLASLIDQMQQQKEQMPLWSRIDTVCVLDKGLITNELAEDHIGLPEPASKLIAFPTNRALLMFYTLISSILYQAKMPDFRITDYTAQIKF